MHRLHAGPGCRARSPSGWATWDNGPAALSNPDGYALFTPGLALYRAGRYPEALEALKQAHAKGDPRSPLGLAMTLQRQGQVEEARRWLAVATEWYDSTPTQASSLKLPYDWRDFPQFTVLYAEAREQFERKRPVDDPKLTARQARARKVLQELDQATYDYDLALLARPTAPDVWLARARRLIELKRPQQAEADLARAVAVKPSSAEAWKLRGVLYADLGQPEKAAADLVTALELLPAGLKDDDDRRAELIDQMVGRDEVFRCVMDAEPKDPALWEARINYSLRRGRWQDAAEAATNMTPLATTPLQLLQTIAVFLHVGDHDGYRPAPPAGGNPLAVPNGPDAFASIRKTFACLIAPGAVDDLGPIVTLAEKSLPSTQTPAAQNDFAMVRGMAAYRSGQFARAVEHLNPFAELPPSDSNTLTCRLFLAMARQQVGNTNDARRELESTREAIKDLLPRLDQGQVYQKPLGWQWCDIALREAETVIGSTKAPTP